MRPANKNDTVTRAGSGLGRAIALGYSEEGAGVVAADINGAAAEQTTAAIRASSGRATAVEVDVSQRAQLEAMVARALEEYSRIHVLVAAAGIATVRNFRHWPGAGPDRTGFGRWPGSAGMA